MCPGRLSVSAFSTHGTVREHPSSVCPPGIRSYRGILIGFCGLTFDALELGSHSLVDDGLRDSDAGYDSFFGLAQEAHRLGQPAVLFVGAGGGCHGMLRALDDAGRDARRVRHGFALFAICAVGGFSINDGLRPAIPAGRQTVAGRHDLCPAKSRIGCSTFEWGRILTTWKSADYVTFGSSASGSQSPTVRRIHG